MIRREAEVDLRAGKNASETLSTSDRRTERCSVSRSRRTCSFSSRLILTNRRQPHSTKSPTNQGPSPLDTLILAASQSAYISLIVDYKVCSGSGDAATPDRSSTSINLRNRRYAPLTIVSSPILSHVEHLSPSVLVLSALAYGTFVAKQCVPYRVDLLQRAFVIIGVALGVLAWYSQLVE